MNYATVSLKNHLTSACLKMPVGEADTVSLILKAAPQMIRRFPLLFIIIHQVFK